MAALMCRATLDRTGWWRIFRTGLATFSSCWLMWPTWDQKQASRQAGTRILPLPAMVPTATAHREHQQPALVPVAAKGEHLQLALLPTVVQGECLQKATLLPKPHFHSLDPKGSAGWIWPADHRLQTPDLRGWKRPEAHEPHIVPRNSLHLRRGQRLRRGRVTTAWSTVWKTWNVLESLPTGFKTWWMKTSGQKCKLEQHNFYP